MGPSQGTARQERSEDSDLSRDRKVVGRAECPENATLLIWCYRPDIKQGIDQLKVKIQKLNGPAFDMTTQNGGEADFGEVAVGDYQVWVDLQNQATVFFEVQPFTLTVKSGKKNIKNVSIEKRLFRLRVIPIDRNNQPLTNRPWKLSSPNAEGSSNAEGLIETYISKSSSSAILQIRWRDRPQIPPPLASNPQMVSITSQPVYPRLVNSEEFHDKDASLSIPLEEDDTVQWELTIDDLKDFENRDGLIVRLRNLGFLWEENSSKPQNIRAATMYRTMFGIELPNREAFLDHIKSRHDKP